MRERLAALFKLSKGFSFDQIAKTIGQDEIWLAAAFYGQVCNRKRLDGHLLEFLSGQVYKRPKPWPGPSPSPWSGFEQIVRGSSALHCISLRCDKST